MLYSNQEFATPQDALAHFGVRGMRWGVRKDENVSPKSSKELVKVARKNFHTVTEKSMDIRIHQNFAPKPIDSSKLSNRSRTIKEGREFYRLVKEKNKEIADTTYVSTNAADRKAYRAILSNMIDPRVAKRSYSPTYEMVLKATRDLSLPSEKARFDAFVELLDNPSIPIGRRGKTITGREFLRRSGHGREVNKLDSVILGEKYYTMFVQHQGARTPLNSAYFKLMREKGYDVISDDNDRNVISNDPLIVLDTATSVKTMYVRRLTNDEINKAIATFTPPKNIDKVLNRYVQQPSERQKGGD